MGGRYGGEMRITRMCDKYYISLELGYILRKVYNHYNKRKGHTEWKESRHIRNRDGQLIEISRCPFCGKRHW